MLPKRQLDYEPVESPVQARFKASFSTQSAKTGRSPGRHNAAKSKHLDKISHVFSTCLLRPHLLGD